MANSRTPWGRLEGSKLGRPAGRPAAPAAAAAAKFGGKFGMLKLGIGSLLSLAISSTSSSLFSLSSSPELFGLNQKC